MMFDGATFLQDVVWWGSVCAGVWAIENLRAHITQGTANKDDGVFHECSQVEEEHEEQLEEEFFDCIQEGNGWETLLLTYAPDNIPLEKIKEELESMTEERDSLRKELESMKKKIEMLEMKEADCKTSSAAGNQFDGSGSSEGKENNEKKNQKAQGLGNTNGFTFQAIKIPPMYSPLRPPFTSLENDNGPVRSLVEETRISYCRAMEEVDAINLQQQIRNARFFEQL
ncbi:hypothetical protein BSKO_05607 [Bryopsis sp. KO-2023]|nr:hypothetical protein BSKO_05607 [Bryopsis sp. KO-2023]